jgi:hypothetical protein
MAGVRSESAFPMVALLLVRAYGLRQAAVGQAQWCALQALCLGSKPLGLWPKN